MFVWKFCIYSDALVITYRVLTVHGSMDEMVPVEDAKDFNKYISSHKLHIIVGADHEYSKHQDELASVVLDFLAVNSHDDKDMPTQFAPCREKIVHSRF